MEISLSIRIRYYILIYLKVSRRFAHFFVTETCISSRSQCSFIDLWIPMKYTTVQQ